MRKLSFDGLRPPAPRLMELFILAREQRNEDILRWVRGLLPRTDVKCRKCGDGTLVLTGEGLWD